MGMGMKSGIWEQKTGNEGREGMGGEGTGKGEKGREGGKRNYSTGLPCVKHVHHCSWNHCCGIETGLFRLQWEWE